MSKEKQTEFDLGFQAGISNEEYHADRTYVSSSVLKLLEKDVRSYYKQYVLGEEKLFGNQGAMDLGSYIHALILEPHLVDVEFAVFDGAMRRGKAWDAFLEDTDPAKTIITKSQAVLANDLVEEFYATSVKIGDEEVPISSFFEGGKAEESLFVELDGVKVKVRFDYRKQSGEAHSINDIKTTAAPISSAKDAEKICASFGYDVSAALYCDAVMKATGNKHDFYFCFLSKKDGGTTIFKASEQMLESGRVKYKRAIEKLKEGRETGIWFENKIEEINSI
jgi:hypothetical protein